MIASECDCSGIYSTILLGLLRYNLLEYHIRHLMTLNMICKVYGIHFEKGLLDHTYVIIDHKAYFHEQQEYAKCKRKNNVQS